MIEQEEQVGFDRKTGKRREEPPSLPGAPGLGLREQREKLHLWSAQAPASLGIKLFLGKIERQEAQRRNFCRGNLGKADLKGFAGSF